MKLLILTQKIDINDDDLAFTVLWIKEFIKQGVDVKVVCLERGDFDDSFPVFSLGKERGLSVLGNVFNFYKYIFKLKYDKVFVHMNPEYITLGCLYWFLFRKKIYLWYTHYAMHFHLFLSGIFCTKMFAATKQSLPQYNDSPKKEVVGHGIDVDYWLSDFKNLKLDPVNYKKIVSVHRICRSKRIELAIKAISLLPEDYSLDIYGRDVEKDYYQELLSLVKNLKLENRVIFRGPVPMGELKNIYPKYRLMINMAPETIDKTVLEGMIFGIYPITTKGNSEAVGLPIGPTDDNPESIVKFILSKNWKDFSVGYLQKIVIDKHSLVALIRKLINFFKK